MAGFFFFGSWKNSLIFFCLGHEPSFSFFFGWGAYKRPPMSVFFWDVFLFFGTRFFFEVKKGDLKLK